MFYISSYYICTAIYICSFRFRLMCDMWAQSPNDRLLISEIKEKLRDILITPQTVRFVCFSNIVSFVFISQKIVTKRLTKVSLT